MSLSHLHNFIVHTPGEPRSTWGCIWFWKTREIKLDNFAAPSDVQKMIYRADHHVLARVLCLPKHVFRSSKIFLACFGLGLYMCICKGWFVSLSEYHVTVFLFFFWVFSAFRFSEVFLRAQSFIASVSFFWVASSFLFFTFSPGFIFFSAKTLGKPRQRARLTTVTSRILMLLPLLFDSLINKIKLKCSCDAAGQDEVKHCAFRGDWLAARFSEVPSCFRPNTVKT